MQKSLDYLITTYPNNPFLKAASMQVAESRKTLRCYLMQVESETPELELETKH